RRFMRVPFRESFILEKWSNETQTTADHRSLIPDLLMTYAIAFLHYAASIVSRSPVMSMSVCVRKVRNCTLAMLVVPQEGDICSGVSQHRRVARPPVQGGWVPQAHDDSSSAINSSANVHV
ncbi:MAG: hypothetical protein KDA58_17320, partial [Planctomycetaceae bacterium]|nr:hypothetical protein [Planctomycetaceae bacterium]